MPPGISISGEDDDEGLATFLEGSQGKQGGDVSHMTSHTRLTTFGPKQTKKKKKKATKTLKKWPAETIQS